MKFKYDETKLEPGYYIVSVNGNKTIAECYGDEWSQLGIDYDFWRYTSAILELEVVAQINIETMEITPCS